MIRREGGIITGRGIYFPEKILSNWEILELENWEIENINSKISQFPNFKIS